LSDSYSQSNSFNIKNAFAIAILGESKVGKSAITCRYLFKKFMKEYTATIEDIYTKRVIVDDEPAEVDILDTAGL
jgi:GTPase KRas protein